QVGEQVELLEDDSDALPDGGDVDALGSDLLALEEDAAALDRLQQVDAAEQGALAAAAGADDDDHLAPLHIEVDAVQHEVVAEALAHALEPDARAALSVPCGGQVGVCGAGRAVAVPPMTEAGSARSTEKEA